MSKNKKLIICCLFLIGISYFGLSPIFNPGFFRVHDDTQVARVVSMGRALLDWQFPVRWVSDLGYGYGYPIFNFYAPLPYYVGGLFYALGASGLTAAKTMMILGIILSGLGFFFAVRLILGNFPAFIGAVFYLYAPYRAVQLYVRGSVGEFWALIFIPVIYTVQVLILQGDFRRRLSVIGGLGFAGLVLSHNITAYIVAVGFILINISAYLIFWRRKPKNLQQKFITQILIILAIGLGASAFFWLPAAIESRHTRIAGFLWDSTKYWDHYVCLSQLWNSPWGFAGSAPGCIDGMSFKLGKIHILAVLSSFIVYLLFRRKEHRRIYFLTMFFIAVSIFMMLEISDFVWKRLPLSLYIQYPWRFLSFWTFFSAVAVGFGVFFLKIRWHRYAFGFLIGVFCLWVNAGLFYPQNIIKKPAAEYETLVELRFRASKISDEYLTPEIIIPSDQTEAIRDTINTDGNLRVEPVAISSISEKYRYKSSESGQIILNKMYFPGWIYKVNGRRVAIDIQNGLPQVYLPASEDGLIELKLENTPVRWLANLVSFFTILSLFYVYGRKTYDRYHHSGL